MMTNKQKKVSISVTLPPEVMDYLSKKVEFREFASFAHGIELCVRRYMDADKNDDITYLKGRN